MVEMTGEDVEIICGEWEIGRTLQVESGEKYNILMQIKKIKRHPGFKIDQGVLRTNYLQDDIAVIIVEVHSFCRLPMTF